MARVEDAAPATVTALPSPRLRPFVSMLWAHRGAGSGPEIALPSGQVHLVVRLDGEPAEVSHVPGIFEKLPDAVVGAMLASPYRRRAAGPSMSIGAMLRPGAAQSLLGAPGRAIAGSHVALGVLWRGSEVEQLRELGSVVDPIARLAAFDRLLAGRLNTAATIAPELRFAANGLAGGAPVAALAERVGWSHRHLTTAFEHAVGLPPKAFQRVNRFNHALERLAHSSSRIAEIAAHVGYADQAHLTREFAAFAGLTPAAYRRRKPRNVRHVPTES